ncbi:MAG: glycosyltransferase [Bacteroidia bacterium]
MKLSVVIVNYNVKHFLDQCLQSVLRSMKGIEGEVIVIDNHSVDGSVEMLSELFPEVKVIANKDNVGFSKANNQGINQSNAEYVLLLNPDTVVEEDTLSTCIDFMDSHKDAGALGVKLIDGTGAFLPESKRGLPTPEVAFYKISGLSKIFPKSKRFGKYHMGYLPENETNEIEILSGAFMFIRKEALNKTGLLDETFFMYGEDIDLSYRITQAGYKIYYHPETRVIHYRGESTKKSSVNYVFVFYQAMIIFANKHFMPNRAKLFSLIIKLAVYLRAGISVLKRFFHIVWLPAIEATVFFIGMYFLKDYWAIKSGIYYPYAFIRIAVPLYISAWIISSWLSGAYDKPLKLLRSLRGIVAGTVIILLVYALLDEQFRYSRFLTLVGAGWAAISATGLRLLINLIRYKSVFPDKVETKRILIIGEKKEADRVAALLNQSHVKISFIGFINPGLQNDSSVDYTGSLENLKEMVEIFKIKELIFCGKDLSSAQIMDQMMMMINHPELEYKIAPPESLYIIGSNSIQANGDLYTVGINSVDRPSNRRKKRIFDISTALIFLILFPILFFVVKSGLGLLKNIFRVLSGKKTWVGYSPCKNNKGLPKLKTGVVNPLSPFYESSTNESFAFHSNLLYAKDYRVSQDMSIISASLKSL